MVTRQVQATTSIPVVRPYPMPVAGALPDNTVSWVADAGRAALLVHDMQRYFLRFLPAGRSPTRELLRNARRLRETAKALSVPVLYTAQPGNMTRQQRGLLHDFWGAGMSDRPDDREIVEDLAPTDDDHVFTKWRYSAFTRSDLHDRLVRLGRDQLVICGVYAHIGCLMTASEAFALDIQPFFVADALADFSREEHDLALTVAAKRCAMVRTTDQLLAELEPSATAPERVRADR